MCDTYDRFIRYIRELWDLRAIDKFLWWDQQTYMPPEGSKDRSLQRATLATVIHERLTSEPMARFIEELSRPSVQETMTDEQRANVREMAWEYSRAASVPPELVRELARTCSRATGEWARARERSDWSIFRPHVERIIELKMREAEAIGYEDRPYDALLDGYEPGMRSREVEALFSRLRKGLVTLLRRIVDSEIRPDTAIVTQRFPVEAQMRFNEMVIRAIGFDLDRGRLDVTTHPFTSGTLHDTRITTRYCEGDIRPALFATIHEAGHALYQQGTLEEHYGTPMGTTVSLGIHESQSRSWENLVGRGIHFWRFFFPRLAEIFPSQMEGHTVEEMYAAVNDVAPSLIRVEADEVTYNLHILLRFEIEMDLFGGKLDVGDAPDVWNEHMEEVLGLTVPDDAHGVLQDIHWSIGAFGYFPTYTLGNLYAAQFYRAAREEVPDMEEAFVRGDFGPFLEWSRRNIHRRGRLYRAPDLCRVVTGGPLDESVFLEYLERKFGPLYGI